MDFEAYFFLQYYYGRSKCYCAHMNAAKCRIPCFPSFVQDSLSWCWIQFPFPFDFWSLLKICIVVPKLKFTDKLVAVTFPSSLIFYVPISAFTHVFIFILFISIILIQYLWEWYCSPIGLLTFVSLANGHIYFSLICTKLFPKSFYSKPYQISFRTP